MRDLVQEGRPLRAAAGQEGHLPAELRREGREGGGGEGGGRREREGEGGGRREGGVGRRDGGGRRREGRVGRGGGMGRKGGGMGRWNEKYSTVAQSQHTRDMYTYI